MLKAKVKMKAAILKGPREVVLKEVPVPEISDDEVLVEVKYCGICGTDLHSFEIPSFFEVGTYLGHEISGIVAEAGKKVKGWKSGDRVTVFPHYQCGECYSCRHGFMSCCERFMMGAIGCVTDEKLPGGFAKFIRVPIPHRRLYSLPEEVSFEEGVLVEPLACSLHAIRMSAFRPGDPVMVLGAGPIGLGAIAFLKNAGAGLIIATEIIEKRAEVARKLGADYVFNPQETSNMQGKVLELTEGLGVAQVFECSGVTQAFQSVTEFLRPRGQIVLIGHITTEVPIIPLTLQFSEFQLQAVHAYGDEFPIVIESLRKGVSPFSELITSRIKLSNIVKDGFEALLKPNNNEIKIIVAPE
jgi:2-desacetyl-2-hydroxyethyl bacteriochlorophyllide A dehydrogenase